MLPACVTAFFNALAALFNWRAKNVEWGHNNEIYANVEKLAALARLGTPESMLEYERLSKHVSRQRQLIGALHADEGDTAPPRAIPLQGGDTDT